MYDNRGCIEIDHSTGVLVAGASLLRVDSDAVLTNATSSLVNIDMSAATAAVALLVEGGAVARTTSLVSINDSTTSTGASLYVSSASASTAKIAHIVAATAGFTGSALYLDVGTASQHCNAIYIDATSAHNVDCIYVTSTGVLANNKGVLNIEHAGVLANAGAAVVRIVEGAVDVTTGSMLEVDAGATATGVYGISVIGGAAVRTSALVNIADATSSTGASLNVAVSGTSQTNAMLFAISNVAGTGNLLKLNVGGASTVGETALAIDATSAHTVQTINIDTAGIVADNVGVVEIDHSTGEIVAGGSLLRVDSDKALANACALVNIDMSAATAAYALWIEGGAAARTSDLINIDDNTSNSGHTLSIARVASSGNMINLSVGAYAYTGTAIAIDLGNASTTGAKAMTIDVTNAQTTDVIAITSTAVLANNLGVLNITNTGIMANDGAAIIRVDSTAVQNVGGALCELTDNSASTAGAILRVASAGARTADVVNITTAAAVLAQDKGVINLNHTGVMAHDEAALIRVVNNSAQTTGGALLELQDAAASTAGAVLRISGAGARTADVVNITTAATILADNKAVLNISHTGVMANDGAAIVRVVNNSIQTQGAMVELDDAGASTGGNVLRISASNAARTGDIIAVTNTSTSTSDVLSITQSGAANSGSLVNLVVGAVAYAGTALNIDVGDNAILNARAIAIDSTASSGVNDVVYINSTNLLANNKGVLNIEHAALLANDRAAVVRIVEGAVNCLNGSLLEADTGATATGLRGISVIGGAVARNSSLVLIADAGTGPGTGLGEALTITSATTGSNHAASITATNSSHTGSVLSLVSSTATNGSCLRVTQTGASTNDSVLITSAAVLAADKGVLNISATGVRAHSDASTVRIKTSGVQTAGALLELDESGQATGGNVLAIKGGTGARTTAMVDITDAGTNAGPSLSITTSGTGAVHYGLYLNATGAQAEALKVDAGVAVFDESVTITGTAILGANTIYVRSDAAGILSLTTADAAPDHTNLAQQRFILRRVTSANPSADVAGMAGELVSNVTDSKVYHCTAGGAAGAATWVAQT
jgi:hypothetical protein